MWIERGINAGFWWAMQERQLLHFTCTLGGKWVSHDVGNVLGSCRPPRLTRMLRVRCRPLALPVLCTFSLKRKSRASVG